MPNLDGTGPLGGRARAARRINRPLGSSVCTCPKCQHQEPHRRGSACSKILCPKCGTALRGENCYNSA